MLRKVRVTALLPFGVSRTNNSTNPIFLYKIFDSIYHMITCCCPSTRAPPIIPHKGESRSSVTSSSHSNVSFQGITTWDTHASMLPSRQYHSFSCVYVTLYWTAGIYTLCCEPVVIVLGWLYVLGFVMFYISLSCIHAFLLVFMSEGACTPYNNERLQTWLH